MQDDESESEKRIESLSDKEERRRLIGRDQTDMQSTIHETLKVEKKNKVKKNKLAAAV